MHRFIKPLLIAGIACACCVGASAQQAQNFQRAQQLSKHEALIPVAPTTSNLAHRSALVAGKALPTVTHAAVSVERTRASAASAPASPPIAASVAPPASGHASLTPAALQAATKFHLDPTALSAGAVKAISDGRAEVVNPATVADKAGRDTVFVTRISATATRVALSAPLRAALPTGAPASAVRLGYVLNATTGAEASPVRLVALVANNTGLVLDAAHSAWRGGFSVALSNVDDPTDRRALNTPITVAITAAGASEVTPAPLEIADVGRWHAVRVSVPDFPGDSYRVAVSADPQDRGNAIELPVSRPTIQVIAADAQIPGWGIGKTTITVRARGLISPEGYPVTLRSDHGSLDPAYVKLDAQGVATANLRSDTAASATVRVGDAGVSSEPASVTFEAPWWFLAAAVAGGLLGAFIRGRGRRRVWHALAIGVASALLMTLAFAVGIDWVSRVLPTSRIATTGLAVVAVLGAIGALVGVGVLLPASGKGKRG